MQKTTTTIIFLLFLVIISVSANKAQANQKVNIPKLPDLLQVANKFIAEKKFQQALSLLKPYEVNYAGNVEYDYFYGVALLESNKYGEAIFALERVVAIKPKFNGAKFELARALYHSKEYVKSKSIFEELLQQKPPEQLEKATIAYIRAIQKQEKKFKSVNDVQLSFLMGYDNNANNSVDQEFIEGVFLDTKNIKEGSTYWGIAINDQYSLPIAPDWFWKANAGYNMRRFTSADFVNRDTLYVGTGLLWNTNKHELNAQVNWLATEVDGSEVLNSQYPTTDIQQRAAVLNVNYLRNLSEQSAWGATLGYSEYRHDNILEIRDMSQLMLQLNYQTMLGSSNRIDLSVFWSEDEPNNPTSPYDNNKKGGRLKLIMPVSNDLTFLANANYQQIDYAKDALFIGNNRNDILINADFGFNKLLDNRWSLLTRVSYSHHESNIALYDYYKSTVDMIVSYQF